LQNPSLININNVGLIHQVSHKMLFKSVETRKFLSWTRNRFISSFGVVHWKNRSLNEINWNIKVQAISWKKIQKFFHDWVVRQEAKKFRLLKAILHNIKGETQECCWKSKIRKDDAKYTEKTLCPGKQTGMQNGLPESLSRRKLNQRYRAEVIWEDNQRQA